MHPSTAPDSPPGATETRGIIAVFASHRVAANLLMFLFILAGLWALKKLNTQIFPVFELDYISISGVERRQRRGCGRVHHHPH